MSVEFVANGGRGISGLMFDGDGKLFACGSSDGKIYLVNPPTLVATANLASSPQGLACDSEAQVYATDSARSAIVSIKADGSVAPILEDYEGAPFRGPHAIIFDSTNQMYFTDPGPYGDTSVLHPKGSAFIVSGSGSERILRPIALESLAYPTGITLSPSETVVYICEQSANRILRFVQRPAGVYQATVFHQFAGRLGPSSIVCDHSRDGLLYVARPEVPEISERGLISILSAEGQVLKEIDVPGPEITSMAISPDAKYLYFAESTNNELKYNKSLYDLDKGGGRINMLTV